MGKYSGNQGAVYIGGHVLSPDLTGVDTARVVDTYDTTGMSMSAKTYIAGLQDGTVAWKGFYDDSTPDGLDTVLSALVGVSAVASFAPSGPVAGAVAYCGQAELMKDYKISSPVNGVVTAAADFVCSGGLDRSIVIQPKATLAGTGAAQISAAVDNGAATTNGGRAYFHLLAVDAAATITEKLQHSADNVTFVDLTTSGINGSAPTGDSQSVAVGTTVNRYLRNSITTTTGKNATIQSSFARY